MNDIGFERHGQIVWQSLNSTDGDCNFVDELFKESAVAEAAQEAGEELPDERTREQREEHE